ncbi:MAG: hypothetical protein IPF96_12185 [Rhodobacter sp.]|nr:hypothetical protein [Rhodobacter sp.]
MTHPTWTCSARCSGPIMVMIDYVIYPADIPGIPQNCATSAAMADSP